MKFFSIYKRWVSWLALIAFSIQLVFPASLFAQASVQTILNLPIPGTMLGLSAPYTPAIMTGITIHPENPLQFDFIVDTGDDRLSGEALKNESKKLINYFMASLTVPENEMWVNLSPHEKNRIIAEPLSKTEMGRDMLAQDYLLKQLAASLLYPEGKTGEAFWKKVRAKAQAKLGSAEIPTDLFNKVWIVPQEATVYVHGNNVFVTESRLKVMLENDYLAISSQPSAISPLKADSRKLIADTDKVAASIMKEIILPEIEKEINQGKNFANLRQIYHSMILATWYKGKLRNSILGQAYLDQNKTGGIEIEDKNVKEKIYNQYLEALKKGVYNYIKEDYDSASDETIPRKYFSGGLKGVNRAMLAERRPSTEWMQKQSRRDFAMVAVNADVMGSRAMLVSNTLQQVKSSLSESSQGLSQALSQRIDEEISSLLAQEDKIVSFLGVEEIKKITYKVLQMPVGQGTILRMVFKTDKGDQAIYVKFKYYSSKGGKHEGRNYSNLREDWESQGYIILEEDPHGDWIRAKSKDGHVLPLPIVTPNPTDLEFRLTLESSQAGIAPPSTVIGGALLVKELENGKTLDAVLKDSKWKKFFEVNKVRLSREIGRQYGRLNRRLGILHQDVGLRHIVIRQDMQVALIDFGSHGTDGKFNISRRINDLSVTDLITIFKRDTADVLDLNQVAAGYDEIEVNQDKFDSIKDWLPYMRGPEMERARTEYESRIQEGLDGSRNDISWRTLPIYTRLALAKFGISDILKILSNQSKDARRDLFLITIPALVHGFSYAELEESWPELMQLRIESGEWEGLSKEASRAMMGEISPMKHLQLGVRVGTSKIWKINDPFGEGNWFIRIDPTEEQPTRIFSNRLAGVLGVNVPRMEIASQDMLPLMGQADRLFFEIVWNEEAFSLVQDFTSMQSGDLNDEDGSNIEAIIAFLKFTQYDEFYNQDYRQQHLRDRSISSQKRWILVDPKIDPGFLLGFPKRKTSVSNADVLAFWQKFIDEVDPKKLDEVVWAIENKRSSQINPLVSANFEAEGVNEDNFRDRQKQLRKEIVAELDAVAKLDARLAGKANKIKAALLTPGQRNPPQYSERRKIEALRAYSQIYALGGGSQSQIDALTLFLTFQDQIAQRLEELARNYDPKGAISGWEMLNFPSAYAEFFELVKKDPLLKGIIGSNFSHFFRYQEVYQTMAPALKKVVQNKLQAMDDGEKEDRIINIAVIGSAYGEEPITAAIWAERILQDVYRQRNISGNPLQIKVHVLNLPDLVFGKVKDNEIIYPRSRILLSEFGRNMSDEELERNFSRAGKGFKRSNALDKQLVFHEFNVIKPQESPALPAMDVVLVHNVVQHAFNGASPSLDQGYMTERFMTYVTALVGESGSISFKGLESLVSQNQKIILRMLKERKFKALPRQEFQQSVGGLVYQKSSDNAMMGDESDRDSPEVARMRQALIRDHLREEVYRQMAGPLFWIMSKLSLGSPLKALAEKLINMVYEMPSSDQREWMLDFIRNFSPSSTARSILVDPTDAVLLEAKKYLHQLEAMRGRRQFLKGAIGSGLTAMFSPEGATGIAKTFFFGVPGQLAPIETPSAGIRSRGGRSIRMMAWHSSFEFGVPALLKLGSLDSRIGLFSDFRASADEFDIEDIPEFRGYGHLTFDELSPQQQVIFSRVRESMRREIEKAVHDCQNLPSSVVRLLNRIDDDEKRINLLRDFVAKGRVALRERVEEFKKDFEQSSDQLVELQKQLAMTKDLLAMNLNGSYYNDKAVQWSQENEQDQRREIKHLESKILNVRREVRKNRAIVLRFQNELDLENQASSRAMLSEKIDLRFAWAEEALQGARIQRAISLRYGPQQTTIAWTKDGKAERRIQLAGQHVFGSTVEHQRPANIDPWLRHEIITTTLLISPQLAERLSSAGVDPNGNIKITAYQPIGYSNDVWRYLNFKIQTEQSLADDARQQALLQKTLPERSRDTTQDDIEYVLAEARKNLQPAQVQKIENAIKLALQIHEGQTRNDKKRPYSVHIAGVARNLIQEYRIFEFLDGEQASDTLAASFLHDSVEDFPEGHYGKSLLAENSAEAVKKIIEDRIRNEVGPGVLAIVREVTKTSPDSWEGEVEYIQGIKNASVMVHFLKLADWMYNFSDIITANNRSWTSNFFYPLFLEAIMDFLSDSPVPDDRKIKLLERMVEQGELNNYFNRTLSKVGAPVTMPDEQKESIVGLIEDLGGAGDPAIMRDETQILTAGQVEIRDQIVRTQRRFTENPPEHFRVGPESFRFAETPERFLIRLSRGYYLLHLHIGDMIGDSLLTLLRVSGDTIEAADVTAVDARIIPYDREFQPFVPLTALQGDFKMELEENIREYVRERLPESFKTYMLADLSGGEYVAARTRADFQGHHMFVMRQSKYSSAADENFIGYEDIHSVAKFGAIPSPAMLATARREGVGFMRGTLTREEEAYRKILEQIFATISFTGTPAERTLLIHALMRIKKGSLALKREFFTESEAKRVLSRTLIVIDLIRLVKRVEEERNKYRAKIDERGHRVFSDNDIQRLLYWKLIPLNLLEYFMAEGLNKRNAMRLAIGWSDAKRVWLEKIEPVRDDLIEAGLKPNDATIIAMGWKDALRVWNEEIKPVRDELVKDGLSKTEATIIVTGWSDAKRVWNEEIKPVRDDLMKDGLGKRDATMIVTRWSDAKQVWDKIKKIRNKLVEDGLNKTAATMIATGWKDAPARWEAIKLTLLLLKKRAPLSEKQLRRTLIEHNSSWIAENRLGIKDLAPGEMFKLLEPLITYERVHEQRAFAASAAMMVESDPRAVDDEAWMNWSNVMPKLGEVVSLNHAMMTGVQLDAQTQIFLTRLDRTVSVVKFDDSKQESLAAVRQVLRDIASEKNISWVEFETYREERMAQYHTGFKKRTFLEAVYDARGKLQYTSNKLVRDGMLASIKAKGQTPKSRTLDESEMPGHLLAKLGEDTGYLKTVLVEQNKNKNFLMPALAAVDEVLEAIAETANKAMLGDENANIEPLSEGIRVNWRTSYPNISAQQITQLWGKLPSVDHQAAQEYEKGKKITAPFPDNTGRVKILDLDHAERFIIEHGIIIQVGQWRYRLAENQIYVLDKSDKQIDQFENEDMRFFLKLKMHAILNVFLRAYSLGGKGNLTAARQIAENGPISSISHVRFTDKDIVVEVGSLHPVLDRKTGEIYPAGLSAFRDQVVLIARMAWMQAHNVIDKDNKPIKELTLLEIVRHGALRIDRAMMGEVGDKKVVDVKRIGRRGGLEIKQDSDIETIVEEPWRDAVRILYRKGLKTDYSSANLVNLPDGAVLRLVNYTVNDRNRNILREIDEQLQAQESGRIAFEASGAVTIFLKFDNETTVPEFSRRAVALVNRLEGQGPAGAPSSPAMMGAVSIQQALAERRQDTTQKDIEYILTEAGKHLQPAQVQKIKNAIKLALEIHAGQKRNDYIRPYSVHVIGVARNLIETFGIFQALDAETASDTIAAAVLHDSVEDFPAGTYGQSLLSQNSPHEVRAMIENRIRTEVGPAVLSIVLRVTKEGLDDWASEAMYIRGLQSAPLPVQFLKLGDWMYNFADLIVIPANNRRWTKDFVGTLLVPILEFLWVSQIPTTFKIKLLKHILTQGRLNNAYNRTIPKAQDVRTMTRENFAEIGKLIAKLKLDDKRDHRERATPSPAMMGEAPIETPGGIDFNASNLNLKEQGSSVEILFNFESLEGLQPDQVNGILPVIINITPIANFPFLLGMSVDQEKQLSAL